MNYKSMLERAIKSMPESALEKERFEVMKIRGHFQGNKTVLTNFYQIASSFNREPHHLFKYILRELAAPGELRKQEAVIGTKINASRINERLGRYVNEFVLCPECGKPDTKIAKEGYATYIKCMACGAKHSVKAKI